MKKTLLAIAWTLFDAFALFVIAEDSFPEFLRAIAIFIIGFQAISFIRIILDK